MTTASDLQRRSGFVSLVGAGPGDPDLLTLKAAARLRHADVVLYDALVSTAALELAPAAARRIFVGKRAGRPAVRQEFINSLLIRAAQCGKHVVRLKGGDPLVFGRGGEEALALAAAGVPFEIIPGISAAIGAASLASIPLTHRGTSSGFVVVSGHAPHAYRAILWALAPHSATIVVMMGLRHIDAIASLLIARGWSRSTPVALVLGASTPAAATCISSLEATAAGLEAIGDEAPGTVVIGEVVRLCAALTAEPVPCVVAAARRGCV